MCRRRNPKNCGNRPALKNFINTNCKNPKEMMNF